MNERWLPVADAPGYEVSDAGRVRSVARTSPYRDVVRGVPARILKPWRHRKGHLYVDLRIDGATRRRAVHALVLATFDRPRPEGLEARHLNGRADDNRRDNLAWGTHAENMQDAVRHGTSPLLASNRATRAARAASAAHPRKEAP